MKSSPVTLETRSSIAAIVIVAAVFAAWSNSFSVPFVFDDTSSIVENQSIRRLASFHWLVPPSTAGETVSGRPVLNFTFAVNYAIGGLDPRGYHLVNVLLHAAAALALFGIVRRTGRAKPSASAKAGPDGLAEPLASRLDGTPRPAGWSAASGRASNRSGGPVPPLSGGSFWTESGLAMALAFLWALHPLQTAAVTYVVQRAEILAGLFLLLTLYCFIRALEAGAARRWFPLSVICCLLGMGTKETMAAAPLLVLLYDRTFVAGTFRAAWQARGRIHGALLSTWLLLAVLVTTNHGRGGSAGWNAAVSATTYFLTQCDAIVHYLALVVWPDALVFDYGTAAVPGFGAVWWQFLLLVALGAATAWALYRNRPLGFLGMCFFLLLAPSSSFIPVSTQTMAEHRMYLPLAAAIVALGLGLYWLKLPVRVLGIFAAAASIAFGAATFSRNRVYRSELALWQDTVAKRPGNPRAHHNLGNALLREGRLDEAAVEFQQAIALQPEHAFAHFGLGTIQLQRGQWADAATEFSAAVAADPHYVAARINLGQALGALGRTDEAIAQYQAALADEPSAPDARTNLAGLLIGRGRAAEAEAMLREVVAAAPELAEAHYHLGRAREAARDATEAEKEFRIAVRLKPDFTAAQMALGTALAKQRRFDQAMAAFAETVRLDPSHVQARANLANCQLMLGQVDDAIANYETALRLRPGDPALQRNLDVARELRAQRR